MAFLMARVCSNAFETLKTKFSPFYAETRNYGKKRFTKKKNKENVVPHWGKRTNRNIIKSSFESLASRDFLRSYKPYTPPPNVREKVVDACLRVLGTSYSPSAEMSRENKFEVLTACFKETNHSVPNSLLHTITTPDDIIRFYETPVKTTTPYDDLKNQDLPPNLSIQYEYKRYDPNDESIFGISAFPENSVIVTGLKSKEKYKGFQAKPRTLLENEKFYKKENVFKVT